MPGMRVRVSAGMRCLWGGESKIINNGNEWGAVTNALVH